MQCVVEYRPWSSNICNVSWSTDFGAVIQLCNMSLSTDLGGVDH